MPCLIYDTYYFLDFPDSGLTPSSLKWLGKLRPHVQSIPKLHLLPDLSAPHYQIRHTIGFKDVLQSPGYYNSHT